MSARMLWFAEIRRIALVRRLAVSSGADRLLVTGADLGHVGVEPVDLVVLFPAVWDQVTQVFDHTLGASADHLLAYEDAVGLTELPNRVADT